MKMREIFKNLFLNPKKQVQCRLMNACAVTGCIVSVIAFTTSCIFKFNFQSIIIIAAAFLVCLITLLIANVFNKPILASAFVVLTINFVILPYMYFVSGGINSGAPIWLMLGLLLAFPITVGKKRTLIMFLISTAGPISAMVLGFKHPEWIIPMDSDIQVLEDVIIAVVIVAVFFGVLYKTQANVYENQRKQIEESESRAVEANLAKSHFISNMTHDIRTPLNSIIGFTEIARKNIDNRTTLLESLSCLSFASEHLLSLVNDVIDISRIESGKVGIKNEPSTITSIIEKVEKIMTPEIEDMNLHLIIDTTDVYDDSISCDVLHLTQVLINLLSNAIKFSNPDGHIYLTVSQKQNPAEDTILCEIRIRDEGIGISPDYLPHIFESFTRESRFEVSGTNGSGLGLSISKQLIELMSGSIYVNSEFERGTEFVIKIPFEMPTLTEIEAQNEETSAIRFDGKKVLVVEDNELNLEIISELLTDAGFQVDSVSDGSYAVEKVSEVSKDGYDIILMDIQMPIMSGYEATRIIRSFADEKVSEIPIIAITANAFNGDREKAAECGMNDFITKPINAHEMFTTIQKNLKK